MNNATVTRRITTAVSGPLLAAGIFLGSMVIGETAGANAAPGASPCTTMPMTGGTSSGMAVNCVPQSGPMHPTGRLDRDALA
jgi:hypothetical protein